MGRAFSIMSRCFRMICSSGSSAARNDHPADDGGAGAGAGGDDAPPLQMPSSGTDPYANVDWTLRGLAQAAEGFGCDTIGGLEGDIYRVVTLEESGPGSLRHACRQEQPLWIVFEVSGTIVLTSPIRVSSYKTIDGRGQRVKLTGKGLQLRSCRHVIVCNLEFEGGRGHDVDAIQIKPDTENVWIDRCTLSDYDDGLIDITRKSTKITVSRCHFFNHDKTMLISADPKNIEDRIIQVTIHHCFFDGTRQRHPRVRFGKVHLYNNYIRNWGIYAVCASVESQIVSQCNVYEAGQKKKVFEYYAEKALDGEFPVTGSLTSEGDVFLNSAQWETRNPSQVFRPQEHYTSNWSMMPAGKELMDKVRVIAGWQDIPLPPSI